LPKTATLCCLFGDRSRPKRQQIVAEAIVAENGNIVARNGNKVARNGDFVAFNGNNLLSFSATLLLVWTGHYDANRRLCWMCILVVAGFIVSIADVESSADE